MRMVMMMMMIIIVIMCCCFYTSLVSVVWNSKALNTCMSLTIGSLTSPELGSASNIVLRASLIKLDEEKH